MNIVEIRKHLPTAVFSHETIESVLVGKVSNINAKIAYMVNKGELIRLKKGLYTLGEDYQTTSIDTISLANILYAPSYVSFDYALSYYGLIPERVHEITSAAMRMKKEFDTPLAPDENFDLSAYEGTVIEALHSFGFEVTIQLKNSGGNTSQHLLNIEAPADIVKIFGQGRLVKIKFEVDTQPPLDFESEKKTLLVPSPFTINTMTLPSLFAGKMHAILCRNWSSRPKGRDWYDLVWYISHGYELNMKHLNARLQQNCSWQEGQGVAIPEEIDENYILGLLKVRIDDLDIAAAKRDVEVFISDKRVLEIWSRDFFMEMVQQIKFIK